MVVVHTGRRPTRVGAVLLGLIGSSLVSLGSCSTTFARSGHWGWEPVDAIGRHVDRSNGGWLIMLGSTVLVISWWLLRPSSVPGRISSMWILAVWAAPLFLAPPVLSADAFVYADAGWILHVGGDVDDVPIASQGGPFAPAVDAFWVGKRTAYPPLAVVAGQAAAAGAGFDPYWGVVAQRFLAVAALLVAFPLLRRLGRRLGVDPGWTVWFGCLNPYVVLHLVGGGHNDALMIAVLLVSASMSTWTWRRTAMSWIGLPALIGLAMAFKPQGVVLLLPVAVWQLVLMSTPLRPTAAQVLRRVPVGLAVSAAVLAGVSVALHRDGTWVHQLLDNGSSPSLSPALVAAEAAGRLATAAGWSVSWAEQWGTATVAVAGLLVCGWLVVTRWRRPLTVAAWCALTLAASTSILAPWHLTLGMVLLSACYVPERISRVLVGTLVGYLVASIAVTAMGWSGPRVLALGLLAGIAISVLPLPRGDNAQASRPPTALWEEPGGAEGEWVDAPEPQNPG